MPLGRGPLIESWTSFQRSSLGGKHAMNEAHGEMDIVKTLDLACIFKFYLSKYDLTPERRREEIAV